MDYATEASTPPQYEPLPQSPPALVRQVNLAETTFAFPISLQRRTEIELPANTPQNFQTLNTPPLVDKIVEWLAGNQKPLPPPQPLLENLPIKNYDGTFLCSDGRCYAGDLLLDKLPVFKPSGEIKDGTRIILYVNGITTSIETAKSNSTALAQKSGSPVICVYNATNGEVLDVFQAITDKLSVIKNPAVETVCNQIVISALSGVETHLAGESHGALVISRAITQARSRLAERGLEQDAITERLRVVRVETFGGAAWTYPDGPRYVHYINECDPVAFRFGLTQFGKTDADIQRLESEINEPDWMKPLTATLTIADVAYFTKINPGKDAKIIRFKRSQSECWEDTHLLGKYLDYHKPHESVYNAQSEQGVSNDLISAIKRVPHWIGCAVCALMAFKTLRWCFRKSSELASRLIRSVRHAWSGASTESTQHQMVSDYKI